MDYIASILKDRPHLRAFVESAEELLKGVDLAPLLMYLIDSTDAQGFPFLADQFGVLGYGGFILANSEEQQRALLIRGLELQRHKGTPWAVKESLKAVGFGEATIVEPSNTAYILTYDGRIDYDGNVKYEDSATAYQWATFDIVFDLGESRGISADSTATAVKIVEYYKPARSVLIGISFKVTLSDTMLINDDSLAYSRELPIDAETARGILYNGASAYDNTQTYEGVIAGILSITVTNAAGNVVLTDTL